MRIKKGDTVYVRSGASRGKTGRVLNVDVKKQMILVEGINMKKRHQRPTQKQPKGGIISIEAPIHLSNVAVYSSTLGGKVTKVRTCRKTGEQI